MAESAPLLHDINSSSDELGNPYNNEPVIRNRLATNSKVLRIVTLVLSVIMLGLLITNIILLDSGNFMYSWGARHATVSFLKWMIPVIILSIINVIIRLPGLLNVVPDITFAAGVIASLVEFINEFPHYQWCEGRRYPTPQPPHPKCKEQKLIVTIIMGVTAGLGIALAATYIGLLCIRAVDIFYSKVWKKHGLSIPTGGISWSISLNVIRDENETSIGISAGSRKINPTGSGQGPVHL